MQDDDSPQRPKRRAHKRVVLRGTEKFDADGLFDGPEASDDPEARRERLNKNADDDRRILNELPPHWGKFEAEGRR